MSFFKHRSSFTSLFLSLLLLLGCLVSSATAEVMRGDSVFITRPTNVSPFARQPKNGSEVIATLDAGQIAEVREVHGSWIRVKHLLTIGWLPKSSVLRVDENAIQIANRAISLYPEDAKRYVFRGILYRELRKHDEALADFNAAVERNPTMAIGFGHRGYLHFIDRQFDQAMQDLNKAIELDPDFALAVNVRGFLHRLRGEFEQSIADHTKAIQLQPDSLAYFLRALAYKDQADYPKALADLSKAKQLDPKLVLATLHQAEVVGMMGNIEKARLLYAEVERRDRFLSRRISGLEEALADPRSEQEILSDLDQAVRFQPKSAVLVHNRGVLRFRTGQYRLAIEDFTRSIELNPNDADAYYLRGLAHQKTGSIPNALEDFYSTTRLQRVHPDAVFQRGLIYLDRQENDEAFKHFNYVIQLDKQNVEAYIRRGQLFAARSNFEDAIRDYTNAIKLMPGNAELYERRAEFLVKAPSDIFDTPEEQFERAIADRDYAESLRKRQEAAQPQSAKTARSDIEAENSN